MRRFFAIVMTLAILLAMTGCVQDPGTTPTDPTVPSSPTEPAPTPPREEYVVTDVGTASTVVTGSSNVFYHIFVGSFSDSNGDGIGDLQGIINRMDYINDGDPNSGKSLGVEGIWLSPIFVSPSYHKYDTNDYYTIDPKFGTMKDLQQLIDLCHERGVKIILDLVINHTSPRHEWFRKFVEAHQAGDPSDPYYNYYTWYDSQAAGVTTYPISGTKQFYEGNFSSDMPELNFDNIRVRQEILDVSAFYLDMGVDGFRFDAAKYIYYGNEPENVKFWNWYMEQLRLLKPDIYTVAEVWDGDGATIPYFSATNCFNFSMSQVSGRIASAAKGGNVNTFTGYVKTYIDSIKMQNPNASMVTFIANHDTDRAAGYLTTATGHAYVAANLSILLPGSTFIYYGEEIGMLGSRGGANTDANRRLAMLWGDGDRIRNPEGSTYKAEQINGTVADQLPDGDSLYNHYKKLIMIRKANPEIAYGEFEPIRTGNKVGGFLSTYEGSSVAVFHNTTTEAVALDLAALTDVSLETLAAVVGLGGATLEGTTLTIEGQTSVVLR